MAATQEILEALLDMQRRAQEALPVIPNNGNPGGAYNMPAKPGSNMPSWLNPSPHFAAIQEMLQNREQPHPMLPQGFPQPAYNTGIVPPQYQQPASTKYPVLPQGGPALPIVDERRRDGRIPVIAQRSTRLPLVLK